jgi:hypothetical protein
MALKDGTIDIRNIINKIKKTIGGLFGEESLSLLGQEAATIIRRRTRLGYGVRKPGGERFRLRALSGRYVAFRSVNADKLSEFTKPGRSNLTMTGAMLDDLEPTKVNARRQSVILGFKSRSSEDKAGWVTFAGRPFNVMSRLEINQLVRFKEKRLAELLRKNQL